MSTLFGPNFNGDSESTMSEESICKYCGDLIECDGAQWLHAKTQAANCQRVFTASPTDRLVSDFSEDWAYQRGVRHGRLAALKQERVSRIYTGPLSGIAREILAHAFDQRLEDVRHIERACESPIEELFALSMILDLDLTYHPPGNAWKNQSGTISMQTQQQIGEYRVDFLFNFNVVVEIDGHDFHDRDQQQASSDRKRDRELLSQRFLVVRYTGSDVYNAPLRCVSEVTEMLNKKIRME
jgi:very-short-patch-repair endonuclease